MDHSMFFVLIPVVAILGGLGKSIVETIVQSAERRHQMSLAAKQNPIQSSSSEFSALRAELTSYKDASTQYDMSLDHVLQRIEHRLDRLEGLMNANDGLKTGVSDKENGSPRYMPPAGVQEDEQVQGVGRHYG